MTGLSTLPDPAQFAASYFVVGSLGEILVIELERNGTLASSYYDGMSWHLDFKITFSGDPSQDFSTIALNGDQRFYGLTNGTISEYRWELNSPLEFIYVGKVLAPIPA